VAQYKHLIGGEAYGVRHAPGDPVSSKVPKKKVAEWLAAGIVEEIPSPEEDEENHELQR
jgi:hypothetical protein